MPQLPCVICSLLSVSKMQMALVLFIWFSNQPEKQIFAIFSLQVYFLLQFKLIILLLPNQSLVRV